MKKLKLNLIAIAALVIAVVTMSFEMTGRAMTFHYDSESTAPGAFADPGNWKPGGSTVECETGVTKPCEISAENAADLQNKLNGKSNQDVLSIVERTRE